MKKLMTVAAVAAMSLAASAALNFDPKDCDPATPTGETCPVQVFKVTGSGKITADVNGGAYKAVQALKISKGALVLHAEDCTVENADGTTSVSCCYSTADLYAQIKVGKAKHTVAIEEMTLSRWSVFGKKFEQAINWPTQIKKGKSVTLESDIAFLEGDGEAYLDGLAVGDDEVSAIQLWASAFGKVVCKVVNSDGSSAYCVRGPETCAAVWTPKNYCGWFVGWYEKASDNNACFACDGCDNHPFGGTWKAVYQAKLTSKSAAQAFAGVYIDEE